MLVAIIFDSKVPLRRQFPLPAKLCLGFVLVPTDFINYCLKKIIVITFESLYPIRWPGSDSETNRLDRDIFLPGASRGSVGRNRNCVYNGQHFRLTSIASFASKG